MTSQTLFTTETPSLADFTDGPGDISDYEFGMKFSVGKAGTIDAIRYYKAASETGSHTGKIWSISGTLITSVTFVGETSSGWQQQALDPPLSISAGVTYVVSVNANVYYVATPNGFASTIVNGDITATGSGNNGVFSFTPNVFPDQTFNSTNYFRDIVFTPAAAQDGSGGSSFAPASGSGSGARVLAASGNSALTAIASSGGAVLRRQSNGSSALPPITSSGTGFLIRSGAGTGGIQAISGSGSGALIRTTVGSSTLASITGLGSGSIRRSGSGVSIITPAISSGLGGSTATLIGGGSSFLMAPISAGVAKVKYLGSGSSAFTAITSSGSDLVFVTPPKRTFRVSRPSRIFYVR